MHVASTNLLGYSEVEISQLSRFAQRQGDCLMTRFLVSSCVLLCLCAADVSILTQPQLAAQEKRPSVRQLYGRGVTAYFTKEYQQAHILLSQAVDLGSRDPRCHYFRGLCALKLEQAAEAKKDFENAANLEFNARIKADVARALEKVQGPERQQIEAIRRDFRRKASAKKPVSGRERVANAYYVQGLRAYSKSNYKQAHVELSMSIDAGSRDPRAYYFRAFTAIKLGKAEDAEKDFIAGAKLETLAFNGRSVDRSIERIQGSTRAKLELHRVKVRAAAMEAAKIAAAAAAPDTVVTTPKQTTPPTTVATTSPTKTDPSKATTAKPKPATPKTTVQTRPAAEGKINSAWLHPDSEVFVVLRVAELWEAEFLKPLLKKDEVTQSVAMMQQMIGLGPGDVDTITIGLPGVSDAVKAGPAGLVGAPGLPPGANLAGKAAENFTGVIRTKVPYNRAQITTVAEGAGGKPQDHQGTTIYIMPSQDPMDKQEGGFFFASSREVVVGDIDSLKAAIDQGQDAEPITGLEFVDATQHLLIVYRPKDASIFKIDEAPPEGTPPSVVKLFQAANGKLDALAFGIFVNDNVTLKIMLNCQDNNVAKAVDSAFQDLLTDGKALYETAKGQIPAALAQVADDTVSSVKSRAIRTRFQVIATVPGNITEAVAQAGPELMLPMMMLMGGLSGGSSGPPLPGQNVEPPKASGIAEGLAITATAKKVKQPVFIDGEMKMVERLEIALDAVGMEAKEANGFGFIEIKEAKDDEGNDLKLFKDDFNDITKSFVEINRDEFFGAEHPENGARLKFQFEPSAGKNERIATLDGVVKLRIVGDTQEIVIDKITSYDGKMLDHPDLKAAGYQFKVSLKKEKFGDQEVTNINLEVVSGPANIAKDKLVQELSQRGGRGPQAPQLLDASEKAVENSNAGFQSIGNNFSFTVTAQGDIAADAKLKIVINKDVNVIDAPFSLKDIAIAAAE